MSRNGSGTFSVSNTFVASTRVLSADVNENFEDLGDEITNSLALDGQSSMTGPIKAAAGTVSAPGYSWANEATSGWYRAGAGDFRYAVGGTAVVKITSAGLELLSGAFTGLGANAIVTTNITDANVTTAKLADGAVTTVKIADANVTFAKLTNVATAAEFQSNTASRLLAAGPVWTAAGAVTLTDGATVTLDMSAAINAKVTLGGNRTLAVSNTKVGQGGLLEVIQDGTGSRTLSYTGGSFVFAAGAAPTLTTTASARDILAYQVLNDGKVLISAIKAVA